MSVDTMPWYGTTEYSGTHSNRDYDQRDSLPVRWTLQVSLPAEHIVHTQNFFSFRSALGVCSKECRRKWGKDGHHCVYVPFFYDHVTMTPATTQVSLLLEYLAPYLTYRQIYISNIYHCSRLASTILKPFLHLLFCPAAVPDWSGTSTAILTIDPPCQDAWVTLDWYLNPLSSINVLASFVSLAKCCYQVSIVTRHWLIHFIPTSNSIGVPASGVQTSREAELSKFACLQLYNQSPGREKTFDTHPIYELYSIIYLFMYQVSV